MQLLLSSCGGVIHYQTQEMAENIRLSLRDKRRQDARDVKLTFREELRADRTREVKRYCPCNVCLGEIRSLRYRAVVCEHLRKYGRHPYYRGSTEVCHAMIHVAEIYAANLIYD